VKTKELIAEFISAAPGFYKDLELPDIDDKHTKILAAAYDQFKSSDASSGFNFRSWGGQSDLTVPAQLSLAAFRANGTLLTLLKYAYRKAFRRDIDRALTDTILDDIEILKAVGGEKLLKENPIHLTPGAKDFCFVDGISVSIRWLRYLYLLQRIQDLKLIPYGGTWLDVGSYYGGLQGLVKKYRPDVRIVLADFHHQLCRSYIYLKTLYPEAVHVLPGQLSKVETLTGLAAGAIAYLPATDFHRIADQRVDLVTNFFSFGEMRRSVFDSYFNSIMFRQSGKSYLVNRFVSSPFFEKTYDSDLNVFDYSSNERDTEYFDVFPMHLFMQVKRPLFGRNRLRNVSSPFFEMISSTKA
jgi:putative sugar O-methyltransferase